MPELKLTVTDRAMERMLAMGREFTIAAMQLTTRGGRLCLSFVTSQPHRMFRRSVGRKGPVF